MTGTPLRFRPFLAGLTSALLLTGPIGAASPEEPFMAGVMPMVGKDGKNLEPLECVAITSPNPAAVMRAARLTELRCTGSSLADAEIIDTPEPQDEAWDAYVARAFQCAAPGPEPAADGVRETACRAYGGWRRLSLRVKQGDRYHYVLVVPAAREAALDTVAILAGKKERRPAPPSALAEIYDETRLLNGDPQTAYYEASRAAENYMAREDYEKAERALSSAENAWARMPQDDGAKRPLPPTLLLMHALALSNQGRFDEANGVFQKVSDNLPNVEPPPSHKIFRAMHAVNQGRLQIADDLLTDAAGEYESALSRGGDPSRQRVTSQMQVERLGLTRDALDMDFDLAPSLREKTRAELLDNYRALLYLQAEIAVRRGDTAGAIRVLTEGADRIEREQPTASSAFASRTWSAALFTAAGDDKAGLARAVQRLEAASETLVQVGLGGRPQAVTWMRLDALYSRPGVTRPANARPFDKARDTLRAFGQFVSPVELETHMLDQYTRATAAEDAGDRQGANAIYRQMLDDLQLIRGPRVTQAMVDNALSADSGDEEVKRLVQRIRVLEREIRQVNDEVGQVLPTPDTPGRAQRLEEMKKKVTDSQEALLATQLTLQEKAPTFSKLAQAPVKIEDIQKRLAGGKEPEALVTFMMGPDTIFGFRLDADRVKVWTTKMTSRRGEELIATVRASASLEKSRGATGQPVYEAGDFDKQAAYDLYTALFVNRDWLKNAAGTAYKEIKVISSGSLASLPLGLLITTDPRGGGQGGAERRDWNDIPPWDLDWLIKDVAITYLPSLRAVAATDEGRQRSFALDYLGFGVNRTNTFTDAQVAPLAAECAQSTEALKVLRTVSELKAEKEVESIASTFDTTPTGERRADYVVGDQFSIAGVAANAEKMRQARVLHFASHAFQGGVIPCVKEPGILVTPPAEIKSFDDLVLTASAVSRLRLDADLVVLSACSTAAAGGGPDREPLSGLVNGFLVAGARSVMTTFWNAPNVAVGMTTSALFEKLRTIPGMSTAKALQGAQLAMLNAPRTVTPDGRSPSPKFSHPYVWAVFGLVGDGGVSLASDPSTPPS